MKRSSFVHAGLAVSVLSAALLASAPARAESSAASSASDSVSDSVGSISTSINGSSNSSSGDKKVAAGDYKVIDMAAVDGQPGMVRLHLLAAAEGAKDEFFLTLPQQAVANGHVAQGNVITANARPYGLEFAAADTKKAFFLVVEDDWHRELASHPVAL